MSIFLKKVKYFINRLITFIIFRPYYAVRTFWPVWLYVLNRRGRRPYERARPNLSSIQRRILEDLRQDGIAVAHLDGLFPGENLLSQFQAYARSLRPFARPQPDKPFLLNLWNYNEGSVLELDSNPFVYTALRKPILDIVNSYMGMWSKFFYCSLNVTLPVGEVDPIKSQRWHRDYDDKKTCKIFIYLADVNEESGPFTYIAGSHRYGKWGRVAPQNPPKGSYPSEDKVFRVIPRNAARPWVGKAGSMIFCDTAGLHRGGYAKSRERLMFTGEFSSPASFARMHYSLRGSPESYAALAPEARFAVDPKLGPLVRAANLISRFSIKYYLY